eukprot:gene8386-5874_t
MDYKEVPNTKNLKVCMEGTSLFICCDLKQDCGPSSSGKTVVIASTCGNKPMGRSNAFLGLNLFVKGLDKRQLTPDAVADLKGETFTEMGSGCQWRIMSDGTTLCIKINFSDLVEKPATSGKSVLLATSSGNKPVGKTGILCGLNCYRPQGASLDLSRLSMEDANSVGRGETREFPGGLKVTYVKGDPQVQMELFLKEVVGALDGEENASKVVSFAFSVDDVQVRLLVKLNGPKKLKVEPPAGGSGLCGGDKLKNLSHKLLSVNQTDVMYLSFDPSQTLGPSASGKSISVSSSSGFQLVCGSSGEAICTLSINAYKPQTEATISAKDVHRAVSEVLDLVPKDEVPSLSFKSVVADVMEKLELSHEAAERYKPLMKSVIKEVLSPTVQAKTKGKCQYNNKNNNFHKNILLLLLSIDSCVRLVIYIFLKMKRVVSAQLHPASAARSEALSACVLLKETDPMGLVAKGKVAVPNTNFEVRFTVQRLVPSKTMSAKLSSAADHKLSDGASWEWRDGMFTVYVECAALGEGEVMSSGLCEVYHLRKTVATGLQVFLAVDAPPGYVAAWHPEASPSPNPTPRRQSVSRRLQLSASSARSDGSLAVSPRDMTGGLIGVPSRPLLGAGSLESNCLTIDDSEATDVVLRFFPLVWKDSVFAASGYIYDNLGITLSILRAVGPSFPPKSNFDDSPIFNVSAVQMRNGSGDFVEVHFDSTQHRPGVMKESRPLSARVGQTSIRRRMITVAECNGLHCGGLSIDLYVRRSVEMPTEDELYNELQRMLKDNQTKLPLDASSVEYYTDALESRFRHLLELSEEDIEEFHLMLWSAVRRCIFDSAKLIVMDIERTPDQPLQ